MTNLLAPPQPNTNLEADGRRLINIWREEFDWPINFARLEDDTVCMEVMKPWSGNSFRARNFFERIFRETGLYISNVEFYDGGRKVYFLFSHK